MGTVAKYVDSSLLYDKVLAPLEADLVKLGGCTSIDVNCIIDEEGNVWPLEFTCRLGWPQFNLEIFAHTGDPAEWMVDACNGIDSLNTTHDIIVGVCLVTQGFPITNEDKGIAIYGLTAGLKKYIQPQFIKMGKFIDNVEDNLQEVEEWVTSGTYNAVVCASGQTLQMAQKRVYSIIDKISISNLGYRIDIGDKVAKSIPVLNELGFATEWK